MMTVDDINDMWRGATAKFTRWQRGYLQQFMGQIANELVLGTLRSMQPEQLQALAEQDPDKFAQLLQRLD